MICRYRNFLGPSTALQLYNLTVSNSRFAVPSTVVGSVATDQPIRRKSFVLDDRIFEGYKSVLTSRLLEILAPTVQIINIPPFSVKDIEIQITGHRDGDFFGIHRDNGTAETASRKITFVYYFHKQPKRFEGGYLVFHHSSGDRQTLPPIHDSVVLFDSSVDHEVTRIICPSKKLEDGRFTMNGWFRA